MSEDTEWVITIIASGHCKGAKFATLKMSLCYEEYFTLKTIKAQKTQEETLTFLLTA